MTKRSTRSRAELPRLTIDDVRSSTSVDSAAVILEDADAIKVLIALRTNVGTAHWWVAPRAPEPTDIADRWRWLVSGWRFDEEEIGAVAGISADTVRAKLRVLVGNRLAYPDGVPSPGAALAISAYVGKRVPKPRGQQTRKEGT